MRNTKRLAVNRPTPRLGTAVLCTAIITGLFGCDSSLQPPSDDPSVPLEADTADIEVYEGLDNRSFPRTCEAAEDCDDQDPCTQDACEEGVCTFTLGEVRIDPVVIETAAPATDVIVQRDRLFVAEGEAGVELFDITDPDAPELIAETASERPVLGITVISGYLVASEGNNGIEFFSAGALELSSRQDPDSGAMDGVDEIWGMHPGNRYLFVSGYADGVLVLDDTEVSNPVPVALVPTEGRAIKVVSTHNDALVADSLGGGAVIDLNAEDGPAVSKQFDTIGRAVDVDLKRDTGVVAEHGGGFSVLDLSNAAEPVRLSNYPSVIPMTAVVLIGPQTLLVGDETGRIQLFDISIQYNGEADDRPTADAAPPLLVGTFEGTGSVHRFSMRGDIIAAAMGDGGVILFNTGCSDDEEAAEE